MTETMPARPGYYCLDPHAGWIRFDTMIEMLGYYNHCGCECRIVTDPIEESGL